jgi:ectoine hydroxylase-related dioxygenase (phytanoyl-CoA dioxygenase family)
MTQMINQWSEEFNTQGYLLLKNFVSNQGIKEMITAITQVFEQALDNIEVDHTNLSLDQKYQLLHLKDPDLKSRCYDLLGHLEPLYRQLLKPCLHQLGQALFDSALLVDGMTVRVGEQQNQRLLPMHQDFGHLSKINLNVWCALTKCGQHHGGLRVIPRSHLLGRVPHKHYDTKEGYQYHGVLEKYINTQTQITLEMSPGDVLIFHPYLIHGSVKNETKDLRWSAIFRMNELNSACYLQKNNAQLKWPQHSKELFGDV